MGLIVADILSRPPLQGARLLAGGKGLTNEIKMVTFMEHMDVEGWLQGGELLLTTGYALREDEARQRWLVSALARASVAALVIKVKRFVDELAPGTLALADELGLPIIEWPLHLPFVDIINPVLTDLLNQQTAALRYAEEVHRRLTALAIKGGGLEATARVLAELLGNPVFVLNADGREPLAVGPAPSQLLGIPGPLPDDLMELLALESGVANRSIAPGSLRRAELAYGEHLVPALVGAVFFGSAIQAYVVVPEIQPVTDRGIIAIEQALTVATLEVAQQHRISEVERSYRHAFLEDLLAGRLEDDEVIRRALRYGIDLTGSQAALVLALRASEEMGEMERVKVQVLRAFMELERRDHLNLSVLDRGETIVALIGVHGQMNRPKQREWLKGIGRRLLKGLGPLPDRVGVRVGIGRVVPEAKQVGKSFVEACQVLQMGERILGPHFVAHFDDLGYHRLVNLVAEREELISFAGDYLGDLLDHDRKYPGKELLPTLVAYLKCGGNLRKTASSLKVYYGTVRYRLERIRSMLTVDLDDPRERINLFLAISVADHPNCKL